MQTVGCGYRFRVYYSRSHSRGTRHRALVEERFLHVMRTDGHERARLTFGVSRLVENGVCWFPGAAAESTADRAAQTAEPASAFRPHVLRSAPSAAVAEALSQAPLLGWPMAPFASS